METQNKTNKARPLSLRGRTFLGVVRQNQMHKTVIVEWDRRVKLPKFDRFNVIRKKLAAHVPEGMELNVGDVVKIKETRPISKTKNFVVIEKMGFNKDHIIKEESKDEADQSVHKISEEKTDDTKKDEKSEESE